MNVRFLLLLLPVTALAASFPKSNPEKEFAGLKIYDAAGRPCRTAQEDWAGARQRVAADPAWAAWVKKEGAEVDRWSRSFHDRVEWVAGWSHDGVSPKDGSRVRWTEEIPGEQVQFFSSASDPQIPITPKLMAWWVVGFREKNVGTMQRAARLYRLTGDGHYATWVAGQMDFYADNYLKWMAPQPKQGARLFWQTLTEASNLVKYTEAVRLLGDYVTAERRERWRTEFFAPEVAVLNANFQQVHNIATWQRCAAAQVALLFGDDAMWREAIDGKFGLRRQMADGITSDYLWYEQSLGYNAFVVRAVTTLFTTAGVYDRAAELAPEMAAAENLMLAPIYLRFPNGQIPNPADSGSIGTAPNLEVMAETYRVFPTAIGLTEAAKRRDWDELLDPPEAINGGAKPSSRLARGEGAAAPAYLLPPVTSRNLESTRMALLKAGPWQVFFHYGQLTRSHTQAEVLNFSAFFNDTDVTHDNGTVGYGSPLYRGYYTRGANHNVPLVGGEGEEDMPQPGELLGYSENPARVSAAQPHYRKDARAGRTLAIDGDTLVDTATIESTKGPERLGETVHVQGKARLPENFAVAKDFAAGRPEPFSRWRDVRTATFRDRAEFDVDYGRGVVLHVTIATPGEFALWHGSTPDVPPRRRESFYLELVQPAAKAVITTTFAPVR
jgi:oligo-alginate lyase